MKRSEILELINKAVNISDQDIETILTIIEKAGMLPPPTLSTTLGQWEND